MNELLVVFYILATLALAYLWIYPKYIGNNIKLMAWVDAVVTSIPIGISAILFWTSDPIFQLFTFELNWFFFTLIVLLVIELPIFLLYLKARNLGKAYWQAFKGDFTGNETWASIKSVEKQLNDTRWDGLRTDGAKRFLLISSNVALVGGTIFLLMAQDNAWTALSLIHILLVFVFWFLLRTSVRLVSEAPDEALDERLIQVRNKSYVSAYRYLSAIAFGLVTALLVYSIVVDFQTDSDGFNYLLSFTWPQMQALFWLIFGYSFMLPSMALIAQDLKTKRVIQREG
jgi:hypothetical protein